MYFFTKISKRNVKSHAEYNKQIVSGTRYIQVSNGIFGKGARSVNLPLELVLKDFSREEIMQAFWLSRKAETASVDHSYEKFFQVKEELDFAADYIPF